MNTKSFVSVDKRNVFFSLSPLASQEIYYQNNSPQSARARLRWKSRLDRLSFIGFPHGIKHSDASLIYHSYRKLFVYLLLFLELPVHFSSSSAVSRTNTVQQASVVLLQFNGRPAMKRMLRVKSRIKAKVHYLDLASYCSIPSSKEHIKTEAFNCTREKNHKL